MSNISHDSHNKKRGLGRGLGSLLGDNDENNAPPPGLSKGNVTTQMNSKNMTTQKLDSQNVTSQNMGSQLLSSQKLDSQTQVSVSPEERVWIVSVEKLSPGAFQPRKVFDRESLKELAQSIKENDILQPIIVRRSESGKLEIIAGERRWRAAQMAGKHEVPVIIKSVTDKEALELAIIENIQRENLNPIEEAEGYEKLISEFQLSQQEVAEKVGKERATVTNAVRLLGLSSDIKDLISHKQLSVGHAKVLLSLSEPGKRSYFAKKVVNEKIPVRQLEKIVKKEMSHRGYSSEEDAPSQSASMTEQLIQGLSEEVQKILGTRVQIDYKNSKGKIIINYYSDAELTNIIEKLRAGCQN
ncbi:MAG TPA: ParB/RepB/Spo0J family partition protein [Pseudobdellovibrionaceae bacterium]|nr:ParB/RepB/Spo0J family partition protein [Pseudobdellovibrionaceae bacterium]